MIDEPTIITIDTETTLKNTVGKNKANPFCPDNKVILIGAKLSNGEVVRQWHNGKWDRGNLLNDGDPKNAKLLVGQNIKFDIHHLRKRKFKVNGEPIEEWLRKNQVWDIQLAEYILTGQQSQFASLDDMSVKYGLPLKDDKVKELFKQGIGADGIDLDTLKEYNKQDVLNTEAIARAQMEEASRRNLLPLIMAQMDALIAIEDIEYNGIAVDPQRLNDLALNLENNIDKTTRLIAEHIASNYPSIPAIDQAKLDALLNLNSNQHLSAVLFGGDIKYEVYVANGLTKAGTPKTKKVINVVTLPGLLQSDAFKDPTSKSGVYKVGEDVLERIKLGTNPKSLENYIATEVLALRKITKEYSTYYVGLQNLIHPDGLLHPNIHQVGTDTGRTSQSEPNGQNIPSSDASLVKTCFVSRFGSEGRIVPADYKQLEVVALAYLSRDPQLLDDIRNGRDIHDEVAKIRYGVGTYVSKEMRRVVKTINFGLIYGGSAGALSSQAGVTESEAQECIDAFYVRYPGVKEWQKANISKVAAQKLYVVGLKTKAGLPAHKSVLKSCTGREYIFTEFDNPYRRGSANFSPTQIKNYPVQGFATGDVVPTMLGVLWKAVKSNPNFDGKVFLVNIVHDEFVFDCHESVVDELKEFVKEILEDTPKYLKKIYGIDFDLPTVVNISSGYNWKEQE
jgi:DNA polymerase-1